MSRGNVEGEGEWGWGVRYEQLKKKYNKKYSYQYQGSRNSLFNKKFKISKQKYSFKVLIL